MPTLAPTRPTFPVLCLSRDTSVSVAHSEEDLCSCNAHAFWHNEYFRDLVVIDATGAPFRVAGAATSRPFSAAGRLLARIVNRRLRVDLDLQPDGSPSLAAAKARVSEWLDRAPDRWESGRPLEAWKRQIGACGDVRALIRLLG